MVKKCPKFVLLPSREENFQCNPNEPAPATVSLYPRIGKYNLLSRIECILYRNELRVL